MIFPCWPQWFRDLFGGEWPGTYIAFDTETSGFKLQTDVITQIAHCLIEDGKETSHLSVVLDWTNHHIVKDEWLRNRLKHTATEMWRRSGQRLAVTYERMKDEGVRPPEKILAYYLDFFTKTKKIHVAAHGGHFDESMLEANLIGFKLADEFTFGDNRAFDTSAIERANQMVGDDKAVPRWGETMRRYFRRLASTRQDLKSSLDKHCNAKYGLSEKLGLGKNGFHDALPDARAVHLLMEEFRKGWGPVSAATAAAAIADPPPPVHESPKPDLWSAVPEKVVLGTAQAPRRRRGQRNR